MDMDETYPVHTLRSKLEAARLSVIEELAASSDPPAFEAMHRLAVVQSALSAVNDEIALHRVHVGGGSEQALR